MRLYCDEIDGPKMANLLAGGLTPLLPPRELEAMGFDIAAYPLELLNASIIAMRATLRGLAETGKPPDELTMPFADLCSAVGFQEYYAEEAKYKT